MSTAIIQQRLNSYNPTNTSQTQQALREISQEIILMSLARNHFFNGAEFHGGTALRIFYGLPRFSEDLDFALLTPDPNFKFMPYIEKIASELEAFGYQFDIKDRSKAHLAVKKAFLKDHSLGHQLTLATSNIKIVIKVEIDTNPPASANTELKHLTFPVSFGVQAKDLPSNFSGKCHALLCRPYLKGRDWYDFLWYISNNVYPNLAFLTNCLNQSGPWQQTDLEVTHIWLIEALKQKITAIDWQQAAADVAPFLKPADQAFLKNWDKRYFLTQLQKVSA